MTLENKVLQFKQDADIAHQVIHGNSATVVNTEGGPVRSIAKLIADNQEAIDAQAPSLAQLAMPGGSALMGFQQAGVGATPRNAEDKLRERVSPEDFFLAAEADWTGAVRRAIRYCEDFGKELRFNGVYLCSDEIFVRKTIIATGIGSGAGYGEEALTGYRQISGLRFTGAGVRRIRTRQRWRGSASDPQDAPLSVAFNVQAENCVFRDFTVSLDFDKTDYSPRNFGADWDVAIFVGCRVHPLFENVHAIGYWRQAGFWFDVTRHSELPQFPDPDGRPFEKGTVGNGGDGATMIKCFARGGKWGIRVAGAQPKPGENLYTDPYYDELLGATIIDRRGSFGFSDFSTFGGSIYGTDHHSNRRRDDFGGSYLTSDAGGAMWISGMNGNGKIQGMRFVSTRFATFEPFRVRLGRCNRALFIGCHIENRGGSNRLTSSGGPIAFTSVDTYGQITMEANTTNIRVDGLGGAITANGFGAFIDPAATYHELFSGTSGNESTTYHKWVCNGVRAWTGILSLTAETNLNDIQLLGGSDLYGALGRNGLKFGPGATNAAVITEYGNLDFRCGAGFYVSMRDGTVTTAKINSTVAEFIPPITAPGFKARSTDLNLIAAANTNSINFMGGADIYAKLNAGYLRPTVDNAMALGGSASRFSETYTGNVRMGSGATIETSASGTPEGVVTAAVGSRYWRTDGTAGTRLYWKATGAGNTGWVAIL